MTAAVTAAPAVAPMPWPHGWADAEVVDAVLVESPPGRAPGPGPAAGGYDRFGRPARPATRGLTVSVLA